MADSAPPTLRGDALYAQGHSGVAVGYYRRALELDPDYAPALVGMGQSIHTHSRCDVRGHALLDFWIQGCGNRHCDE